MCPHARGLPAGPHAAALKAKGPESHRDNPGGSAAYPRKRCIAGRPAVLPARHRAAQYKAPGVLPRQSRPKSGCSCTWPCCRRPAPDSAPVREKPGITRDAAAYRNAATAPRHGASGGASSSFCGGIKPRTALAVSEEDAIVFQLVEQVTHNINVVRRNNEGAGRHALIWPLLAYATPDRKSIRRRETSLLADSDSAPQYAWR